MDELTYEEQLEEQRKKDKIEYRNKKRASSTFMFFASVFEIIETFLIIMVLFLIASFFAFRVFHIAEAGGTAVTVFQLTMLLIFIGGIVLGFNIYKKVVRWAIKKYNLKEKLLDDVLDHYKTKEEKLKERQDKLSV